MNGTFPMYSVYNGIPQVTFSWIDFLLFVVMLGLSTLIGLYYGCYKSKQDTTDEYLLGGKSMKVFPVAMSMIASNTSAIALLAVPADVYKYGATYWWMCVSITLNTIISCYIFMPVFMKLQLISTYEYFQIRFNAKVRLLASLLFSIWVMLFNPIVIYVPALAFSQATGINVHLITPIVCVVCIFYTTIGGLKAVVWTDTLQTLAIAGTLMVVFFLGITSVGGLHNVWQKSLEGDRLNILDFNVDPTRRDSFWALIIGSTASWIMTSGVHQSTVQRFLAVSSTIQARKVMLINCIGLIIIKTCSTITGLIMYVKYSECDPLTSKKIARTDQLLPYYVMDVAGKIPGLPGLFIAGVFSAGLSTLSTSLNSLSGTIYEDFVSPLLPHKVTEKQASNILKLIVVIIGIISTLLVIVVEQMGGVLPLVNIAHGSTGGSLLGLFVLGMLFPLANSKGAICGGVGGIMFSAWMIIGNQVYRRMGALEDFGKPLSVEGCDFFVNVTSPTFSGAAVEKPFVLYRITFWYYTFLGATVTIVIALIVSWFTNEDDHFVHPDLISPAAHFLLPKKVAKSSSFSYFSTEQAAKLTVSGSK